jgi:oxalate decarboxylase/phosphoglucose isomerase-like protein (cupin superfamily)
VAARNDTQSVTDEAPSESVRVQMIPPYADERGYIQTLVNYPIKNVALITSRKGSVRSNHYHKADWHYMYMIAGSAYYYYRPTGSGEQPKRILFNKGELVYTGPMEDHTTVFLEDSMLLAMSGHPRDQETYESDVVRVALISEEEVNALPELTSIAR